MSKVNRNEGDGCCFKENAKAATTTAKKSKQLENQITARAATACNLITKASHRCVMENSGCCSFVASKYVQMSGFKKASNNSRKLKFRCV